jgi:flagellar protein FlgJ
LAISLPSDIVLDAVKAVEPSGVEAVRAALAARRATAAAGVFSLAETGSADAAPATEAKAPEAFKRFEAMVLQTFIESMLPRDSASVYGKGVAGDMWKSMMAEKLADAMAERGGIGISERVLGDRYIEGRQKVSFGVAEPGVQTRSD